MTVKGTHTLIKSSSKRCGILRSHIQVHQCINTIYSVKAPEAKAHVDIILEDILPKRTSQQNNVGNHRMNAVYIL